MTFKCFATCCVFGDILNTASSVYLGSVGGVIVGGDTKTDVASTVLRTAGFAVTLLGTIAASAVARRVYLEALDEASKQGKNIT